MQSRTIDPIWEEKYSSGHAQYYPWDHVVSFIYNYFPKNKSKKNINILEVGCGTGSNLWFAAREGFKVFGIDASESAIEFAKERFGKENLQADLRVGDFCDLPFDNDMFDLVIDRAAITCCSFSDAKRVVSQISKKINKTGKFLFNPYSKAHSSYSSGILKEDGLVVDIQSGTLTGSGQICLYDEGDVKRLFSDDWSLLSMQHLELKDNIYKDPDIHSEWRVISEKLLDR
jgi:2-polyprenyl-3-methyl-5-hydroxy-6-metoxy-1,4-benzoquinol methylase